MSQPNPIGVYDIALAIVGNFADTTITIELSNFVEPYEETNIQLNLTPKYSFVDLHIGKPELPTSMLN